MSVTLRPLADEDFAWLLGEQDAPDGAPIICKDIAPPEIVALIRRLSHDNRPILGRDVAWLIVAEREGVGMISFTKPGNGRSPEVGYGVAPSREGRGFASAAVAALLPLAKASGFHGLTAETAVGHPASQRVLERNGFVRTGQRVDDEDGPVFTWLRAPLTDD